MELDVKKLTFHYDLQEIQQDYLKVVKNIQYDHTGQISLTHRKKAIDPLRDGVGSIYDPITKKIRYYEEDFTEFNENFKSTIFWQMYNQLPFVFGRIRFCQLLPKKCYSLHCDTEPRLHLAIFTKIPECFMMFERENQMFKKYLMPADGHIYYAETTRPHTFLNTDHSVRRVHLLLNIISKK